MLVSTEWSGIAVVDIYKGGVGATCGCGVQVAQQPGKAKGGMYTKQNNRDGINVILESSDHAGT